jgi:hypothetical protein
MDYERIFGISAFKNGFNNVLDRIELKKQISRIEEYTDKIVIIDVIMQYINQKYGGCRVYTPVYSDAYLTQIKLSYKKTILIVCHELSRTGSPVVALSAAKELINEGYFVIVTSYIDGPIKTDFLAIGCMVIIDKDVLYWNGTADKDIPKNKFWNPLLLAQSVDLVIAVSIACYSYISLCNIHKNKILWWIHDGTFGIEHFKKWLPRKLNENIQVFAGGEYVRETIRSNDLKFENVEILNYGIEDIEYNRNKFKKG